MDGLRPVSGSVEAVCEEGAPFDEADALARNEKMWVRGGDRAAECWEAVRLQCGRGRVQRDVALQFGVTDSQLCYRRLKGKWRLMSPAELEALSGLLVRALEIRRRVKELELDPERDAAACEWAPVSPEDEAEVRRARLEQTAMFRINAATARMSAARVRDAAGDDVVSSAEVGNAPWMEMAHAAQLAPDGAWRTWLLMGGRGAGKTRAGAEWVRGLVEGGVAKRVALIGPSLHDVREVMIAGPSGLCAIGDETMRPKYEVTRRRLVWPPHGPCAGAVAFAFSAEDPESLRGPQFDAAWCDEIGAWAKDLDTWKTLAFGMRLGASPRIVATTTPRPRALVKLLVGKAEAGRGAVVMTQAATRANAQNLSPEFVEALEEDYGGTPLGRQELDGELIEDLEGALWTRAMIEAARCSVEEAEGLERVVVAVDPPAGAGGRSNACGIVVAGVKAGVVYVLADATVRGLRPAEWAKRVAAAAEAYGAGLVVAESNQGGEMVRDVLEAAGEGRVRVKLEHASKGKRDRAEPVSAKYDQGRVRHVRVLKELEDEMCSFGAPGAEGPRSRSPDRVDALVWAVTVLTRKAPPKVGVEVL